MWPRLRSWFSGVARRRIVESDLTEELDLHLQARADHWRRQGLPPVEAARRARLEFGAVEGYKERCREARGLRFIDELRSDLRYALRQLRRAPTFTLVVTGTLAIGIGANMAIFSLVDAVLLKTLPVERPHELRELEWTSSRPGFSTWYDGTSRDNASSHRTRTGTSDSPSRIATSFAYPVYVHLRDHSTRFTELFCVGQSKQVNVRVGEQPELASGLLVSGNFFRGLGVPALIGRTIQAADDREGAPPVAVMSYRFWQRRFGGDERILGHTIAINGTPVVIVGITPHAFHGLSPGSSTDVMVPVVTMHEAFYDIPDILDSPRHWGFRVMGRLTEGTTELSARAEAETLMRQAILADPPAGEEYALPHVALNPGGQGLDLLRRQLSIVLQALMAIVGTVLLIACANIAGLLLMRGAARRREIGTRLSLGAPRTRLVRQMLTESLLLALLGGLCGTAVALALRGLLPRLLSWGPDTLQIDMAPDLWILLFAIAACLATGLACGLLPALRATRVDLAPTLARALPGATDRSSRLWTGKTLVLVQVALSFVLLVSSGLFVRTLVNLQGQPLGFRPEQLLLFQLDPTLSGHADSRLNDFYEEAVKRLKNVPGVRSVSLSRHGLVSRARTRTDMSIAESSSTVNVYVHYVAPDYFATMGIPLLAGRDLAWRDREQAPEVAIVNRSLAEQFSSKGWPIGHRLGPPEAADQLEVVGVAADARFSNLRDRPPPTLYLPYRQHPQHGMTFAVRFPGDPDRVVAPIRRTIAEIDPDVPMFGIRTQEAQIDLAVGPNRLFARLVSAFAGLALLLACLGIYGTLACSVTRRTSEIGLRMALGARPWNITRLVLRESLIPVVIGAALGLAGAFLSTRLIESMLFGLTPHDAPTFLAATLALVAAALIAAWLPSRRAARIDPMSALRCE